MPRYHEYSFLDQALNEHLPLQKLLENVERKYMNAALKHHDGHRENTADSLRVTHRTFFNKLDTHGLK